MAASASGGMGVGPGANNRFWTIEDLQWARGLENLTESQPWDKFHKLARMVSKRPGRVKTNPGNLLAG
jgi:hypothetical protein